MSKLNYQHKELFEQLMVVAKAAISESDDSFDALDDFELWIGETYENNQGEVNADITRMIVEKRLNDILEVINSTL